MSEVRYTHYNPGFHFEFGTNSFLVGIPKHGTVANDENKFLRHKELETTIHVRGTGAVTINTPKGTHRGNLSQDNNSVLISGKFEHLVLRYKE